MLICLGLLLALLAWGWLRLERYAGADWGSRQLNRLDGLNRLFCRHYHRLDTHSLALPESGPLVLAANHLSGLDPLLLIAASPRPLRFMIATEQYNRFGLRWLFRAVGCIPVDRGGRPEKAFREALKALRAGEVVALFPHGGIHLDHWPRRPLKPGVSRLAHLAGCPVLPVRLDGVRAPDTVFRCVLLRGHARLRAGEPVACHTLHTHDCLARIEAAIGQTDAGGQVAHGLL